MAKEFLHWLAVPPARQWVEIGSGTGAFTRTILEKAAPAGVRGADPRESLVAYARAHITDPRVRFEIADARTLPGDWSGADAVVSGLVLNFIPEPWRAIAEMKRVAAPGGVVAACVWDGAAAVQMMHGIRHPDDALERAAVDVDSRRLLLCSPGPLSSLFHICGLENVEIRKIDVPTVPRELEDFWTPFVGGGRQPLPFETREEVERDELMRKMMRETLYAYHPGTVRLTARAWAVRGTAPKA